MTTTRHKVADERPPSVHAGRAAGVLLHPTSLPGPFGIGDLGPTAHAWIAALATSGQTFWQVLPLQPTGAGDSPYAALSAFAGNPDLISPEELLRDGLVAAGDLKSEFGSDRVEYGHARQFKVWLLDKAYDAFRAGAAPAWRAGFDDFCHAAAWLDDFALFMTLKEHHGNGNWHGWPGPLVRRDSTALDAARAQFARAIDAHRFRQYVFDRQWSALRQAASAAGVTIVGDAPIFVAADSADVWANPELFLLDAERRSTVVAGVPPDYFSATGQLWGNPIYDWTALKQTGYRWWVDRIRALLRQVDVIRLDHFRGFVAAWHIVAGAATAETGEWVPGPGRDLFDVLRRELGCLPFVAEDLGLITPDVLDLRDALGLPGMRVLQFAFDGGPSAAFLPHNFERRTVAYTGTHDNDTTAGWYASLADADKKFMLDYAPALAADPAGELMRLAWSSVADVAVAPLQDVLGLGTAARMNRPGIADGNWTWRVTEGQLTRAAFDRLAEWTWVYGRKPAK